jgi:fluoride exporter
VRLLLVFLGGCLGAPVRYLADHFVQGRHNSVFPWGTFSVNVAGSFVLGLLMGASRAAGLPQEAVLVAGTGFCGALTTFSTFGFETMRLLEEGSLLEAIVNCVASLAAGLAAAAAGFALAGAW